MLSMQHLLSFRPCPLQRHNLCYYSRDHFYVSIPSRRDRSHKSKSLTLRARLCEMFVGVICACMPSAAYAARQKNSMYQKIVTTMTNLKTSWTASKNTYDSHPHSPVTETRPAPDVLKSTDRKYAHYFSLDELTTTASITDQKSSVGNNDSLRSESIV